MAFTSLFTYTLSSTCKFATCSQRRKTVSLIAYPRLRLNRELRRNTRRGVLSFDSCRFLFSLSVLAQESSIGSSSAPFSTDSTENDVISTTEKQGKLSLEQLQLNREYDAIIAKVTEYGAFVDIGAIKYGLLHVSHMSDSFVRDPSELVKEGDCIKVRVLRVDLERGLFSVTMRSSIERKPRTGVTRGRRSKEELKEDKRRLEGPNLSKALLQFAETVDSTKFFKANVLNITDFGVFVDVGGPKDGLIFRPDLTQEVQAGEEIVVRIKKIDVARNFITCTMKPMEEYEKSLPLIRGNTE
ncbi:Protein YhgF [Galdieria sulphuraria]|uniref:3S ribosomal protein S1 n=1 Tax=Galdieria sulphuraria TaxID=130081 RepID=M2XBD1_GALSU|nr:3S ribosomal protein S1 [Galdieria sulphuraria]EME27212.1 3S ribosomal protein S1 [Galdieria sulphuraria]GJD07562.1 Protein YhgF [Galdieria sulphuraria]|eukprot:XP_005703732.1 3S ribosomal protein S1 [Galdieria sulphuraria]